jgi:thioredoxin-dependent peroxiredoxin
MLDARWIAIKNDEILTAIEVDMTKSHVAASAKASAHEMEGRKAPAFALPDGDGTTVTLDDLISRGNLVLYFYPKDMTPGCTTEACAFRDTLGGIKALGALVVGISADPPQSHRKFADKHTLSFPLLSDTTNRVTRLYGVYKKKSLYGREFMGIERTTFVIDRDGVIRKVFPKVRVDGHADEVVKALKAIR